jgi:D-amino-acid dehydrogenase
VRVGDDNSGRLQSAPTDLYDDVRSANTTLQPACPESAEPPGGQTARSPSARAAGRDGGRAAIVGAGIVGLSVAWFLQEAGFDVTVYDRRDIAGGASAGNAGWICPAMVTPLPEPSVLRYAVASLFRPNSPLRIPPTALPATAPFLVAFAAHCTSRQWRSGVSKYARLSAVALESYSVLTGNVTAASVEESAMFTAFERPDQAGPLRHELQAVADTGVNVTVDELSGPELRREQPLLGPRAGYGLRIGGQKFLRPLSFVRSLAAAVADRGGTLVTDAEVLAITGGTGGAKLHVRSAELAVVGVHEPRASDEFDLCVLANGAWITRLAHTLGVRKRVFAGRGYSFTVTTPEPLRQPFYVPALRVACTPVPGGMRVAGTMEFRDPDDPIDTKRIAAIVRSARDFMPGIDWSTRSGEWVGPRPVTADGLPIIGRTNAANVYVAGGHGMWGMTLGPATGRLLTQLIVTGEYPQALLPFDPLR